MHAIRERKDQHYQTGGFPKGRKTSKYNMIILGIINVGSCSTQGPEWHLSLCIVRPNIQLSNKEIRGLHYLGMTRAYPPRNWQTNEPSFLAYKCGGGSSGTCRKNIRMCVY